MTIWRAELSTKNFDFWAYGETKTEAKTALRKTFELHIFNRGGWYSWSDVKSDVFYSPCKTGQGYVS